MFLHNLKYEILQSLRVKDVLVWLIIFPIVLGTFFKIVFTDLWDKTVVFDTVPVAVVETSEDKIFHSVIDEIESSDSPLLKVTYTDKDKAMKLLEDKKITGIIFIENGEKSLTVASESGTNETIVKSFLEQYMVQEKIITDTVKNDPAKLNEVISVLGDRSSYVENIPLTEGDPDPYTSYFYNLIAMVGLFGSITGLHIVINNQANLSPIGARRNCSPTPKLVSILAALIGSFIVQAICVIISVSYIAFVLKVDFGARLPLVYVSGIIGGITGVSMGFFVGSFGNMSEGIKVGISMAFSMISCFLSGLMVGNMKAILAEKAPWVNEINPAALISDSFYCLDVYSDYDRYIRKSVTLLIICAAFILTGSLLTRRKKYASV